MKKQKSLERTYPNQLLHQSGLESVLLNSQTSLVCQQVSHIHTLRSEARNRCLRASVVIQKSQDNLTTHDFNIFDGRKHDRKTIPENQMKQHSQRMLQTSYQHGFQPGKSLQHFWKNSKERMETVECIYSQKPMNQECQIKPTNSNKHKIRVVPGTASCADNPKRTNLGQIRQISDQKMNISLENLIKLDLKELLNQDSKCEFQSIDSNNSTSCNFQNNKIRASHSADDGCGRFEEYSQNTLNIHKESKKEENGRDDNKIKLKTKHQAALYYPPLWKSNTHAKHSYPFTFLSRFSSNNASNQDIILTRNEQTKTMPTQATESRHGSNYEHRLSLTRMEEIIPQDLKSKQIVLINQEIEETNTQHNQKISYEVDYSKETLPLNRFAGAHFFSTQRLPSSRNGNNRQSLIISRQQQGVTQSTCFFNNSQNGMYKSCEIASNEVPFDHKGDKKQENCQSWEQLQDGNVQQQHNLNPKMLFSDSSSVDCKNNYKTESIERITQSKQNNNGQNATLQLNLYQKTTRNQLEKTVSQQKQSISHRLFHSESQDQSSSLKVPLQEHQSFGGRLEVKGTTDLYIPLVSQTQKLGQQHQLFQKNILKQFARSTTPRIISGTNVQTVRTVTSDSNSTHNIYAKEIAQECQKNTEIGQGHQQNENLQDCKEEERVEVIPLTASNLLFYEVDCETNSSSKDKNKFEAEQIRFVKDKEDAVLIELPAKIGRTFECVKDNRPNTSQCKTRRRRMEVKQQVTMSNDQQTPESNLDELPKMLQCSSEKFEKDGTNDSDNFLKTQRNIKKRVASMDQIQQFIGSNNNNNTQSLGDNNQQNNDTMQKLAERNTQINEENTEIIVNQKQSQNNDKSKQKQQKNPFLIKVQRALLRTSKNTEDNSSAAQQNPRKPEGSKLHSDFLSLFSQQ